MIRLRLGLAGVGMMAGACGLGQRASPLGEFAPAHTVSAETGNGATPMYLVTPNGSRVLSWVTAPDGGTGGRLAVAVTPPGAAPRPAVLLTDSLGPIAPHGEAPPQLAADDRGTVYGLYVVGKEVKGERFPRSALRLVRSENNGTTWSQPVTVNEGEAFGSHNFHSLLAGRDGAIYVSWLGSDPGTSGESASRIWLRMSRDGGRTWGPTRSLFPDSACPCCRSALALGPDGSLYVAWRKVFPGEIRDVVVARSTDGGETWDEPVRPRRDGWVFPGCPHAGPSLRVDSAGTVHVAWWTGKTGEAGVYYARSDDQGRSFRAQPLAVGKTSRPAHVQLGLAPAGPIVVWDDGQSAEPRILLRAFSGPDGRFGPVIQVSEGGLPGALPVVAVQRDSVRVAWSSVPTAESHEGHGPTDSRAPVPLPRVGGQQILERVAPLVARGGSKG
jgi:hypothetical protein